MTLFLELLVALQAIALVVLLGRLQGGRMRAPPVPPLREDLTDTTVSVVLPTLNEGRRIAPCLAGLRQQGPPLIEVIVVDSGSTDATRTHVEEVAKLDGRFRGVDDRPVPAGWIGKVWALERGRTLARGEWLLGVDADIEPNAGFVAGVVTAARHHRLDMVSFSPQFAGMTDAEQWVQPAMLATLIYRTVAPGTERVRPDQLLANGQCFLARSSVLTQGQGYAPARHSFSDDVTLARHYAQLGYRVGFLDGSRLYRVRSYESLAEMWREWGRSIDLRDSTGRGRRMLDALLLVLTMGLPLPLLAATTLRAIKTSPNVTDALFAINGVFLLIRVLLLGALANSYERPGLTFWLSPLADPLAVARVLVSTFRRPRSWRGRKYPG